MGRKITSLLKDSGKDGDMGGIANIVSKDSGKVIIFIPIGFVKKQVPSQTHRFQMWFYACTPHNLDGGIT